ncbi:DUF4221 family protein [Pararhodonellum marinum]|uniref:DUF4221 family protein n=1 Tax=Pararhodonellum marinum TaxID=2755358 RepID=UPI00188FB5C9|nr:DUF4221 family protein [Pararhodonellum marinum]
MKNALLAFMALTLFIACGPSNESKIDYSQITFTLDTVIVDSKDEILFLIGDLMIADLSADNQYLYYLNPMGLTLEIVDLNQLEFVKRVSYEEEGPNGLGRFPMQFQVLSDERIFIGSFTHRGIFDLEGVKLKNLNFKMDELGGDDMPPDYIEKSLMTDPRDQYKLFSVLNVWGEGLSIFGLIDTQKKTFQDLPIPEFDYLGEFRMIFSDGGNPRAILGEQMGLTESNNKIIVSNNIGSDLYVLDLDTEVLNHKPMDHHSIPSRKSNKMPPIVESLEEFHAHNRKLGEDINFTSPVWDEENQVYYRFAYFMKNKEVEGKPQSDGAEVFLIVLDKDFRLISETPLASYTKIPNHHFVKDGKIWIFENMEDEMAFIRLSIMALITDIKIYDF